MRLKHWTISLVTVDILILFFFCPASLATTGGFSIVFEGTSLYLYKDYHALVVGVSDYTRGWPRLPSAVNDASEVASSLKGLGFSVKLVVDPDSRQLKSALNDLAFELGREENRALLFYFAGHGETLELADSTDLGYIIPKDCPLKSRDPKGFDDKAVSMKDMEALALKIRSRHLLMVFDSCFSGSLFNVVRAAPVDISEKSARPVRQFITSGEAGEQVPDRSVFKVVFLQGMSGDADLNRDGYVTGSELGMHIQDKVVNYTRGGQHPQYGKINNPKLDRGDFIFVLGKTHEKMELSGKPESLEMVPQPLEEKKQNLAYAPKSQIAPRVEFRAAAGLVRNARPLLVKYNFFDSQLNPEGFFNNDFVDNGDGTITDRATGLMWERGGSETDRDKDRAVFYVDKLNKSRFAGYSNWRLPTLEELASLLNKDKKNGVHIHPMFESKQKHCWTSDLGTDTRQVVWIVDFAEGKTNEAFIVSTATLQHYSRFATNYVRAVRSIK